jgi:hypothetical protein
VGEGRDIGMETEEDGQRGGKEVEER